MALGSSWSKPCTFPSSFTKAMNSKRSNFCSVVANWRMKIRKCQVKCQRSVRHVMCNTNRASPGTFRPSNQGGLKKWWLIQRNRNIAKEARCVCCIEGNDFNSTYSLGSRLLCQKSQTCSNSYWDRQRNITTSSWQYDIKDADMRDVSEWEQ